MSSRSHHLGPSVPQYRVGWTKRGGTTKTKRNTHTYAWVIFLDCSAADTATTLKTLKNTSRDAGRGFMLIDFSFLTKHHHLDSLHTQRSHVNMCSSFWPLVGSHLLAATSQCELNLIIIWAEQRKTPCWLSGTYWIWSLLRSAQHATTWWCVV